MKNILIILLVMQSITTLAQWQTSANLPLERRQHCAVWHPDGKIYVWGGWNGTTLLNSLQIFDPASNNWINGNPVPISIRGAAYCLGTDDFIYQISGLASAGKNNSCYKYNPSTGIWIPIAPIPDAVWEASAVCYDSKIYVFGGEALLLSSNGPCKLVQIYDIATNTWSTGTQMPENKMQHQAIISGNEVYVFGGRTGTNGNLLSSTILCYSILTDSWITLGTPMSPGEKNSFGACMGPDNNIYLIGGKDNLLDDSPPFISTVNVFDPQLGLFRTNETSIPIALGENVSVASPTGIYSIGGSNGSALGNNYFLNPCSYYISVTGSILLCTGQNKILTAHPITGSNYLWSNGATTQSIIVTSAGVYSATIDGNPSCNSITIRDNALNGVYTVGVGQDYRTLTEAVTAYNTKCLSGPVTFMLTDPFYPDETYPINIQSNSYSSAINTLTIRPAAGVSVSMVSNVLNASLIKLSDADYIIIDGSNNSSSSRNWTLTNTSMQNSASVWLSSLGPGRGCSHNIIKNLNLSGGIDFSMINFTGLTAGVLIAESINGAAGYDNSDNIISNNYITKVAYGVYAPGYPGTNFNLNINSNIIGPAIFGSDQIGTRGIYLFQQNNVIIKNNTIRCTGVLATQLATNNIDRYGILASNSSGAVIFGNTIYNIANERSGSAIGIWHSGINSIIANNMIRSIWANANSTHETVGVLLGSGNQNQLVYNTISLHNDLDPPGAIAAAGSLKAIKFNASVTDPVLANNIIDVDVNSDNTSLRHFAIVLPVLTFGFGTGFSDYNDIYINPVNIQLQLGGIGTAINPSTTIADLSAWQSGFSPVQDNNSVSVPPVFISATDLHLGVSVNPQLENAALSLPSVTTDYDNEIRPANPDIGADEVPPLSYTYYADADGDGYGNPGSFIHAYTQPAGYVLNDDDCNDNNHNIHPGAAEVCNGIDDDCDGLTDNNDPDVTGQSTWYADADGDGYGNATVTLLNCFQPSGFVANNTDCNDNAATVHPMATEICGNMVDDNCNGQVDEGCCIASVAAASISSSASGICIGNSVTLYVSGGSLGTNAVWKWYLSSCGGTYIGSGNSIIVSPAVTTTYFVRAEGQCGITTCKQKTILVAANTPLSTPIISGNQYGMCGTTNATYTVTPVSGATNYTWTVPSGATLVSGQGTVSISVNFSNSFTGNGNITVFASNSCVSSATASKAVFGRLAMPVISGLNYTCKNQPGVSYSCSSVSGANQYIWTVPSGSIIVSGQGTTNINVNWGNINGVITVTAKKSSSACASSLPATFGVSFTCRENETFAGSNLHSLILYPNPTTDKINLQLGENSASTERIIITDLLGEIVFEKNLDDKDKMNLIQLNLSNLKPGVYLIKIKTQENQFLEKFIKL